MGGCRPVACACRDRSGGEHRLCFGSIDFLQRRASILGELSGLLRELLVGTAAEQIRKVFIERPHELSIREMLFPNAGESVSMRIMRPDRQIGHAIREAPVSASYRTL